VILSASVAGLDGARVLNLTPHPVDVLLGGRRVVLPPQAVPARIAHEVRGESSLAVDGAEVPVRDVAPGEVVGLPDEERGVVYLVSRTVAAACAHRSDLVFPVDLVRDDRGTVVGCRAFGRLVVAR
jgi:hypothetical protein